MNCLDRETISILFTRVSGRVGEDIAYVVNGRQRWRRYTKPADPKTGSQVIRRRRFALLVSRWHAMDEAEREHWNDLARRKGTKRRRGFNCFLSTGMREFEEAQRLRAIKASVRSSSRRFVRDHIRSLENLVRGFKRTLSTNSRLSILFILACNPFP